MPGPESLMVDSPRGNKKASTAEFVRFVATGGGAAICNIGSRMLLSKVVRYEVAVAIAYGIGVVVAFLLARAFVFEAKDQPWRGGLLKFAAVNVVAFAQVWLVSILLLRYGLPYIGMHWHPELVAHITGVATPTLFSYYAHKFFTFRAVQPIEN